MKKNSSEEKNVIKDYEKLWQLYKFAAIEYLITKCVFFLHLGLRVGNETKGNLCNHLHLKVIIFVMKLIESIKNRTGKFWLPTNSEQIWILNEMFVLTSYIVHGSCNNEFETATELNGLNYQGC